MKTITLYTTAYCGYCQSAKRFFNSLGLEYVEVDVTSDDSKRAELFEVYNWRTVPAIFVGDELIGGYDDVVALQARGELLSKLKN